MSEGQGFWVLLGALAALAALLQAQSVQSGKREAIPARSLVDNQRGSFFSVDGRDQCESLGRVRVQKRPSPRHTGVLAYLRHASQPGTKHQFAICLVALRVFFPHASVSQQPRSSWIVDRGTCPALWASCLPRLPACPSAARPSMPQARKVMGRSR